MILEKRMAKLETDGAVGRLKLAFVVGGVCVVLQAIVTVVVGVAIYSLTKGGG